MTRPFIAITSYTRAAPLAVATVLSLWSIGLMSHTITHGPTPTLLEAANLGLPAFDLQGTWYPLASRIWCADLAGYVVTTVLLIALFVPAERTLGSKQTAKIFACTLLGSTAVGMLVATISRVLSDSGAPALRTASAAGPSVGVFGVLLALTYTFSPLWRRRLRVVLLVTLGTFTLYSGRLQDISRLSAALIGLFLGPALLSDSSLRTGRRNVRPVIERQEQRFLVALVVAAAAAGPFLLTINRGADRLAWRLKDLWMAPSPTVAFVRHLCRMPMVPHTCYVLHGYASARGLAAEIRMALPVLIALVLASGLRRGYHSAYVGALGFHAILAGFGTITSLDPLLSPSSAAFPAVRWLPEISADLIPAVVAVLIYRMRRQFTVRPPRGAYRRLVQLSLGALVSTSAIYLFGGYALRAQFDRAFGFGDLLRNLPLRFLPPAYLGLVRPRFYPAGSVAGQLSDWPGAAFWLIALVGLLLIFRRGGAVEHNIEPDRIRSILLEHGGSNLAYMSTWGGHEHWVSADGGTAIAYRVISSVAITTGEPLGDPNKKAAALLEFTEFCATRGWTASLFCVSEEFAPEIEAHGWRTVKIANDAVIPLASFDLSGRRMQDLRTAINRASQRGVSASWVQFSSAPPSVVEQIEAMGQELRKIRRSPELSFTLGGVSELLDSETRCLVAIDPFGVVHGIVSWIPVYRAGRIVGWTLDFMRRSMSGLNGVMDFLIASSALSFKAAGYEFVSLSGVPLPQSGGRHPRTALDAILDRVSPLLNRIFKFESLLAFKDKFQPNYQTLYLGYRDGMDLPRIAYAIGRAYLPSLTVRQAVIASRGVIAASRWRDVLKEGLSLILLAVAGRSRDLAR